MKELQMTTGAAVWQSKTIEQYDNSPDWNKLILEKISFGLNRFKNLGELTQDTTKIILPKKLDTELQSLDLIGENKYGYILSDEYPKGKEITFGTREETVTDYRHIQSIPDRDDNKLITGHSLSEATLIPIENERFGNKYRHNYMFKQILSSGFDYLDNSGRSINTNLTNLENILVQDSPFTDQDGNPIGKSIQVSNWADTSNSYYPAEISFYSYNYTYTDNYINFFLKVPEDMTLTKKVPIFQFFLTNAVISKHRYYYNMIFFLNPDLTISSRVYSNDWSGKHPIINGLSSGDTNSLRNLNSEKSIELGKWNQITFQIKYKDGQGILFVNNEEFFAGYEYYLNHKIRTNYNLIQLFPNSRYVLSAYGANKGTGLLVSQFEHYQGIYSPIDTNNYKDYLWRVDEAHKPQAVAYDISNENLTEAPKYFYVDKVKEAVSVSMAPDSDSIDDNFIKIYPSNFEITDNQLPEHWRTKNLTSKQWHYQNYIYDKITYTFDTIEKTGRASSVKIELPTTGHYIYNESPLLYLED